MAFSGSCALLGRHNFYRNLIQSFSNSRITSSPSAAQSAIISRLFSIDINSIIDEGEPNKKKQLSKAMKAYLQRVKEHDTFIEKEAKEYQIGKRHLANMMGEDPESFTQTDVKGAIQYLFPSGLFDPRARPIMAEPSTIFPKRKAAEFDDKGRPFHSLFYTMRPNYYQGLYDIVESMENVDKIQDAEVLKGLLPQESNKANLIGSDWASKAALEKTFLETMSDKDYDYFVFSAQRLADHPYSASAKDLLMKFREIKKIQTQGRLIPPLEFDETGRPYIVVKDCMRKSSRGSVKILGNGTGKITVNGRDMSYFKVLQQREQVSYTKR